MEELIKNKKNIINTIMLLLYASVTLIAVLHHEIWADEAQVWMLSRHLTVPELIKHLHNEGHPSLFYLMAVPFAKFSTNIIYLQIICWISMCLAAFLIIFKSPFGTVVKTSILTSAGFLYFLPVMVRNYALIPFLVLSAAYLYKKRKEQPILYAIVLFLLANTHAIMLGFVAILGFFYIIETFQDRENLKPKIIAITLIIAGILAVILQLHDTASDNVFMNKINDNTLLNAKTVLTKFITNTLYQANLIQHFEMPMLLFKTLFFTISFLLLYFFINLLVNNKKLFTIAFCGIGFQFYIYFFIYSKLQYVTRIFSAYIILIFCFWILYETEEFKTGVFSKKLTGILISLFFFFSFFNGVNNYILDIFYNYCGAKETAKYINKNIPKNAFLIILDEPYTISLAYYLDDDRELFSAGRGDWLKYVRWDELSQAEVPGDIIKEYCDYLSDEYSDIYIIIPTKELYNENFKSYHKEFQKNFTLKFISKPSIKDFEGYMIYNYKK